MEKSEYGWFRVPEDNRTEWMEQALERALESCAEKGLTEQASDAYVDLQVKWGLTAAETETTETEGTEESSEAEGTESTPEESSSSEAA